MTLGEIIKTYRKKHKISQIEFAEKANLTKGYISMLENNFNPSTKKPITPSIQVVLDVAKAMNISSKALLDLIGNDEYSINDNPKRKEYSKLIGKQLKTERLKAGLSQQQVADVLGYSKQIVSNWENGIRDINVNDLMIICEECQFNILNIII